MIYYRQAGDLSRVVQNRAEAPEGAERSRLSLLHSWGYQYMGLAHYQRNELAAARQCFIRLLDLRYTANIGLRCAMACSALALIHEMAGEQAEAWEMVQFLSQLDLDQVGTRRGRKRAPCAPGSGSCAGNWTAPPGGRTTLRRRVPDEAWPWHDPPHLTKATDPAGPGHGGRCAVGAGAPDCARRRWRSAAITCGSSSRSLALRALVLDALGRARDACDALLAAVGLARPAASAALPGPGCPYARGARRLARQGIGHASRRCAAS